MPGIIRQATTVATNSGSNYYRIPAIAQTASGKLYAAMDYRQGSSSDAPNVIDIQYATSTDGGVTWTTPATLVAHTGGSTSTTAIARTNAALLYDPAGGTSGRLWAFYDYAPANVGIATADNTVTTASTTTVHPYAKYTDNDGTSWSAEQDLIASLKTSSMYGLWHSPGHGWVGNDGTLYFGLSSMPSLGSASRSSFQAYSTNHGTSWQASAVYSTSNPDENHLIQLSDGTFLVNARPSTGGGRLFITGSSINGSWSTNTKVLLPDPCCNGDVIRVDPSNTSNQSQWLLASGCASTAARTNLTVWLSKDNGSTWTGAWQVYAGGAAYSTLIRLSDGTYGIFWENTDAGTLVFSKFSLFNLHY